MSDVVKDEKGFICECGIRNDYPSYAQEHWNVRLAFSCSCHRRYLLFRGTVTKTSRETSESSDGEAFGD